MTSPTEETIALRQWCIEKAAELEDDPEAVLWLAAALIALVETGCPPTLHEAPVPALSVPMGAPAGHDGGDSAPCPSAIEAEMTVVGNEAPAQPLPVTLRPSPVNGPETIADPPPPPAAEPERAPRRSIPRMPAKSGNGLLADLSERDQAVLMAITLLSAGGQGWPSQAQITEASVVPRGSLTYVLERLREKGRLARIDGKWALAEQGAA